MADRTRDLVCQSCETPFVGHYKREFCDKCRDARRKAAQLRTPDKQRCEHCGAIYQPYKTGVKYCPECSPLNQGGRLTHNNVTLPTTRRCRNMRCPERFIPVNPSHWYHEPACGQVDADWLFSVEQILAEEGQVLPGGNHLELAKAAFGQKNRALRENTRLRSLRDYLTYEIRSFYDEYPEYRYPLVPAPPKDARKKNEREVVVQLSDWQVGKWEQGFGIEATMGRVAQIRESVASIVQRTRDAGYPVNRIRLCWGGDLIEGCFIYRGQNVSGLDRTSNTHRLTVQIRTTAHAMAEMATFCATLAPEVVNEVVGGNHGRTNGPNDYADPEDNFDVMAAWWASDLTSQSPQIAWNVYEDWWGGFESMGHYVVMFHGDQWNGPLERLETLLPRWVSSGTFGRKPALALTHHRHTHDEKEIAGIPVLQNGTIDGGSRWYTKAFGKQSRPRQRVFTVSEHHVPESVWPIDFD